MQRSDLFRRIDAQSLFAGLTERQKALLASASREVAVERGGLLFLKGDRPAWLYVVLAGTIKLSCQSPGGEEKVIGLPRAGETFGEAAVLLDSPYPYAASALTAARLLQIDARMLRELAARDPAFARRLMSLIANQICNLLGDIEDYCLRTPAQRIARYLLERSAEADEETAAIVPLPAHKHIFASRLGMVPESLSRAMRDLAEAGYIEIGRRQVKVLDRQRLAALVG